MSLIRELFEEKAKTKLRLELLGMSNTYNLEPEKQIALDIDYHRAKIAYEKAQRDYDIAVSDAATRD